MTTYAYPNFKSKKALKEAVEKGSYISFEAQGLGGGKNFDTFTGTECVCGPHYPEAHRWYAEVVFVNGKVTKVK